MISATVTSRAYRHDDADKTLHHEADSAALHLISQVRHNGFLSASPDYQAYSPHWIRDASWVAISLLNYSEFHSEANQKMAVLAHSVARRINTFHSFVIDKYSENMRRAVDLSLEDRDKAAFNSLASHVPARVDESGRLYVAKLRSASGREFTIDDRNHMHIDSNLRQYDTVPLALMALEKEARLCGPDGLSDYEKSFVRNTGPLLAEYMGKIYMTPCANAWEENNHLLHSYDIAAVHSGFRSLRYFIDAGLLDMTHGSLDSISDFYVGKDGRGPIGFLRKHVHDNILYGSREPFTEQSPRSGVNGEDMFIFTRFGIGDMELGDGVVKSTMAKIDSDLFNGNYAPIRYRGDEYFTGGRWLNLLFERSILSSWSGNFIDAVSRINYVARKYKNFLPEQEIVDPANPGSTRGMRDLEENCGEPIQRLAWSYAARIDATVEYLGATGYVHEKRQGLLRN